ncbi:MAG: hypothetical protein HOW73_03320 [Polyangiaceae bacterium]|nr:hypothetical protein [Polyangiaceae bacterium]
MWGRVPVLAAALALAGCGGGIGGYCYEAVQCEGGNDLDEDACNIAFQEMADLSDIQGCASEFDEWFECVEEESRCNDDHYHPDEDSCGSQWERLDECADLGGDF